jgi:hypothetical protein
LTTNRSFIRRSPRGALTDEQEMELWLGPSHRGSAFDSREELHQAWLKHRDRLMTLWAKNGKRPAGWWEFEAPFPRPFEREASALYEANLLGEQERAELVREWRREFARANEPNFFFTDSPGCVVRGAAARRAHYRWADIPSALIEEWTEERRHRPPVEEQAEGAAS